MAAAAPASNPLIRLCIGGAPREGWTLMAPHAAPGVDAVGDGGDLSMFADGTVVEILAPLAYERFGAGRPFTLALREAFRAMLPGGVLRLSFGDGAWTFDALRDRLTRCGFRSISAVPPFEERAPSGVGAAPGAPTDLHVLCTKASNAVELNNEANRLHVQGRLDEAMDQYELAMLLAPEKLWIRSNALYAMNYLPDIEPAEVFAAHRRYAQRVERPAAAARNALPAAPAPRRLRIGYLSADFREHAVAHFLEPVLAAHDRDQFELFAYSHHTAVDAVTRRMQALIPAWRSIVGVRDEQAAAMVRADGIDILVDLMGHTGLNRLPVFALRPAPVQATWLGYPNTTGLSSMDWRLTDAVADPPGMTEAFHSEKLWRLPEVFSCFQPSAAAPPVAPLPALSTGRVTFGSFNNFAKITPAVLAAWAQILRRVPDASMLLKYRDLDSDFMTRSIRDAFAAHGVDPRRLTILGDDASDAVHHARYNAVDIALDPFPYNGTTTTLDALWMGVPVVTLAGRSHVARVGASQLTSLGCPQWIAATPQEYADIAAQLAADLPRLAEVRGELRPRMKSSPLTDAPRFTRHLEDAYRGMWLEAHRSTSSGTPLRDGA
jgi:predicted O-linked N-acetylglucosamine transferase (SPINDLY family)